ncbi:MAG: winged helix-turn-helix domain-containing protein [Acidobacteriia bacterium]|nr:winged helix-turn-helix domain-containing protein [Terriglobia bacterium]
MNALRLDCGFGSFRLSFESRQLTNDGVPMRLAGRSLEILCFLVENYNRAMTRDAIIAKVWGYDKNDPRQAVLFLEANKSLNNRIAELRRCLDNKTNNFIRMHHGYGYAFVAPVMRFPGGIQDRYGTPADESSLYIQAESTDFKASELSTSRIQGSASRGIADFGAPVGRGEAKSWVELVEVSVPKTTLFPGERIAIEYVVCNKLSSSLDLWLGASLEKDKRRFYDVDEDKAIIALPGKSRHRRFLTLAESLAPGPYILSVSLWLGAKSKLKKSLALGRTTRVCTLIKGGSSASSRPRLVMGPEACQKA